jgi:hypothetical protein
VNVVAGSAAGDTTATVTPASTNFATQSGFHFDGSGNLNVAGSFSASTTVNVSSLAGAVIVRSSAADALVGAVQASTVWAVQVDGRVRAQNSTIGDLLASVQQNSSVWQIQPGSTNWPKAAGLSVDSSNVQNVKLDGSTALTIGSIAAGAGRLNIGSTAADNAVTAQIRDSSGVSPNIIGSRPSTGAQAIAVRETLNDLQSTGISTAGQTSTNSAIISSVASLRHKVYAFSVTSTVVAMSTCRFQSSNAAKNLWDVVLGTGSSGITGMAMACAPPGWLFATAAGEALNFITPSSGPEFHVSVSYFSEA